MSDYLQDLKVVLQTLGLPVTGQVRLVEDECSRIELLSEAFACAHHGVRVEASGSLTRAQTTALEELAHYLVDISQQGGAPLCSELAMRQSASWRQVRTTARKALLRFSWTLEIPPWQVPYSDVPLN